MTVVAATQNSNKVPTLNSTESKMAAIDLGVERIALLAVLISLWNVVLEFCSQVLYPVRLLDVALQR